MSGSSNNRRTHNRKDDNKPMMIRTVSDCIDFVKRNPKGMLHESVQPWLKNKKTKNDDNKRIALAGVSRFGIHLAHLPSVWQNDKSIVLAAVQQNGHALRFASPALQHDWDVVMTAVQQSGPALQYCARRSWRGNHRDLVLCAVRQNGKALQHVELPLRDDDEVVLEAVRQTKDALPYAGPSALSNPKVIAEVVRQDPSSLKFSGSGWTIAQAKRSVPVFCSSNNRSTPPPVHRRPTKKEVTRTNRWV